MQIGSKPVVPVYQDSSLPLVTGYAADCNSNSSCVAFNTWGIYKNGLSRYRQWDLYDGELSNWQCAGIYVKMQLPRPMGYTSVANYSTSIDSLVATGSTRLNRNLISFTLPSDWNDRLNVVEITLEGKVCGMQLPKSAHCSFNAYISV